MAEKDADGLVTGNLAGAGLRDDIAHWAEVLDRWVKVVDTRLGRSDQPQPSRHDMSGDPGASH